MEVGLADEIKVVLVAHRVDIHLEILIARHIILKILVAHHILEILALKLRFPRMLSS